MWPRQPAKSRSLYREAGTATDSNHRETSPAKLAKYYLSHRHDDRSNLALLGGGEALILCICAFAWFVFNPVAHVSFTVHLNNGRDYLVAG